jgi:phosphoglycolate phosphatase
MPVRAALFDFDGTLADSFAAIAASTNHVRELYGLPPLAEVEVRRHVGYGLEQLLTELVPPAPTDAAVAEYRRHHAGAMLAGTHLFAGVADTLTDLRRRGYRLAVCSNKRVEFTRALVAGLGVGELFAEVLGPDDVGRPKPHPAMLLEAARRLDTLPAECVYVGDMAVDVEAGRAAGMAVYLIPGGAGDPAEALAAGPDRVLTAFADLLPLLPGV